MAYASKYHFSFKDLADLSWKVYILLDGFVGDSTEVLKAGQGVLSLDYPGERDTIDSVIYGSQCTLELWHAAGDADKWDEFLTGDLMEYRVDIYTLVGATETLYWRGWLKSENAQRPFLTKTYTMQMTASDGLGLLRDYRYVDATDQLYRDKVSGLTILKRCLGRTGIELDLLVQLNTYEADLMLSTECALDKADHDSERWITIKDGVEMQATCWDVVTDVLRPYNCTLRQAGGKYQIINYQEYSSFVYTFTWSTLAQASRTARNLAISLETGKHFVGEGTLQKLEPVAFVDVTFSNSKGSTNELTNGDFNTGDTTGWSNGPTGFTFTGFANVNNKLRITDGFTTETLNVDSNKTYCMAGGYCSGKYFESAAFTVTDAGVNDKLRITWKMVGIFNSDLTGDYPITVVSIVYPDGTIEDGAAQGYFAGEIVYTNQFPANQSGAYKLRFWIIFRGTTNVTGYQYNFDYFIAEILRETDQLTVDQLTRITNPNAGIRGIEANIKFGDSAQNSDRGALEVDGTNTASWNRHGKTDELPLQVLYCLQLLNDRASYKDIIDLQIKDAARTIFPFSVLTMETKQYRFLSYSRTFRSGVIQAQVIQLLNTDITYTTEIIDVLAQEGVSTGGGSGTNNTGGSTTIFNIVGSGLTSLANGDGTTWNTVTKAVDVDNPIYRVNQSYEGTITAGTYFDIIAAPGAGKFIQLLDVIVLGNTTSASSDPAFLKYRDATMKICQIPIHNTAALYYEIDPDNYLLQENKAIQLGADATVTTGTGGMKYMIYYRVVTWATFTTITTTTTTTA